MTDNLKEKLDQVKHHGKLRQLRNIAALIPSLTFLAPLAKAQDKTNKPLEITVNNESNFHNTELGGMGINYNRTELDIDNLGFKYDQKNNGAKDLSQIAVKDPFGVPMGTIAILREGNPGDKNPQYMWEHAKTFTKEGEDGSITYDIGQFLGNKDNPKKTWGYVSGSDKDKHIMFSLFGPNKGVKKTGVPNTAFAIAGHKLGKHLYGEVAGNVDTGKEGIEHTRKIATLGTLDNKKVGVFGILVADTDKEGNKTGFYKTKFALGDVSQGFYNKDLYDYATGLFTFGPFFKPHFSPTCTKGNFTLGIDGSYSDSKVTRETMAGVRTKYGNLSAGTYFEKENGKDVLRKPVVGYHKNWKLGNKDNPINTSVEVEYDKKRGLKGHVTISKAMKFNRGRR